MKAQLRVVGQDGPGEMLPDWTELQYLDDHADVGTCSFSYPLHGRNGNLLNDQTELALFINGSEIRNSRFRIDESDSNRITDDERKITWSGTTLLGRMDEVLVLPRVDDKAQQDQVTDAERRLRRKQYQEWYEEQVKEAQKNPDDKFDVSDIRRKDFEPTGKLADRLSSTDPPDPRKFDGATPGEVMLRLMHEAHSRGAIPEIRPDFNEQRDSAGQRWEEKVTHRFKAGSTTLLGVLRWMDEQGIAEGRMRGRRLQLFNSERGTRREKVLLARGRNLVDGPEQTTTKEMATALYVLSDSGVHGWVSDRRLVRKYGRIEGVMQLSGVHKWEEAAERAHRSLDRGGRPKMQRVYGVVPGHGADPYSDFEIGDWVLVIDRTAPEWMRVRQIGLGWTDTNSDVRIALAVADRIDQPSVKRSKDDQRRHPRPGRTSNPPHRSRSPHREPDGRAPNKPSPAVVTQRSGSVRVKHDGLDTDGNDHVWDLDQVEVHLSDTSDFTPSDSTRRGAIRRRGGTTISDEPYDSTRFVRLVAVDAGGDRSEASEPVAVAAKRANYTEVAGLSTGPVGGTRVEITDDEAANVARIRFFTDASHEADRGWVQAEPWQESSGVWFPQLEAASALSDSTGASRSSIRLRPSTGVSDAETTVTTGHVDFQLEGSAALRVRNAPGLAGDRGQIVNLDALLSGAREIALVWAKDGADNGLLKVTNSNGDNYRAIQASAFNVSSDRVQKNVVEALPSEVASAALEALDAASFERVDTPGVTQLGFVADEVAVAIPEAFRPGDTPGADGYDLEAVVATLWAAVQQLSAQVRALGGV